VIYLAYLIMATIVVILSIKISDYVDSLDRNTKLSGAFLGGILLSGVTSLPELFTSVSATMLLGHPELCVGNVLGSDLFNMTALAVIILAYFKRFTKGRISKSYRHVVLIVFTMYLLLVLNYTNIINFNILHINITSVLMVIVYLLGAKYLAVAEDVEADDEMIQYQAQKMAEGGCDVTQKRILNGIHGLLSLPMSAPLTRDIFREIKKFLRESENGHVENKNE